VEELDVGCSPQMTREGTLPGIHVTAERVGAAGRTAICKYRRCLSSRMRSDFMPKILSWRLWE